MAHVPEPHSGATARRCRAEPGILAHAGLAVTPAGRPPGLFAMDAAFREDPGEDSRRRPPGLERARELAPAVRTRA